MGLECVAAGAVGGADLCWRADTGRGKRSWACGWVLERLVGDAGQTGRVPCREGSVLEAVGEGTILAAHVSPTFRPAFPSSAIISERSSPSRVRCAAPNNGAPLTACGPFQNNTLRRGKGSLQTARLVGDHFAVILVPFFSATDIQRESAPIDQKRHVLYGYQGLGSSSADDREEVTAL